MRVKILSTILAAALTTYAQAGSPAYSPQVMAEMESLKLVMEDANRRFSRLYRLMSVGGSDIETEPTLESMFNYDPSLESNVPTTSSEMALELTVGDVFNYDPSKEVEVLPMPPSAAEVFNYDTVRESDVLPPPQTLENTFTYDESEESQVFPGAP